ncbi:MAG TPA: glycosyltransferase family 2 protein [Candidatus Moranbacteria bacterium]|nr:glycosyltransferase family 2 protein [Candidatus Moranbacteria bacterium]
MEQKPFISVVIPTYNEAPKEKEMEDHLNSIKSYFEKIGKSYEVIIALDGPTDKTAEIVRDKIKNKPNFRIIDRKENKGKGYSIREGFAMAKGEWVIWTDMDGATPIDNLDNFIPKFKETDIVIGSRDLKASSIKKHQPKWKEWMGNAGNILIQIMMGLYGIYDTQCGFKAFKEEVVKEVFPRTKVDRWGIDFEILMIAKKLGYKIEEVPVEWLDMGNSLVGIKGYLITFRELFKVWWNKVRGVYQLNKKMSEFEK